MVKNFSQKFVVYHGCGAWYDDGTSKIVSKNRKCIRPTYEPFLKKPNDVHSKVETKALLKLKLIIKNDYIRRYSNFYSKFQKQDRIQTKKMKQRSSSYPLPFHCKI